MSDDNSNIGVLELRMRSNDSDLCWFMLKELSEAQEAKLLKKRSEGRHGWERASNTYLEQLLSTASDAKDWVSVANYAGMLYVHALNDAEKTS